MKTRITHTGTPRVTCIELCIGDLWHDITPLCTAVRFTHNAGDQHGPIAEIVITDMAPQIEVIAEVKALLPKRGDHGCKS